MSLGLLVGLPVLVIGVALVAYMLATRSLFHYTSELTCPNCRQGFEYRWVPGASFSALRLGKDRYLECPLCHAWSKFDMRGARRSAL